MIAAIFRELRPSVMMLAVFSLIGGVGYTFAATVLGQALFPVQTSGSMILKDGKPAGSELIGQPSAIPSISGAGRRRPPRTLTMRRRLRVEHGPLNPALTDAVKQRVQALRDADKDNTAPVPVDLVTASASGLDPHITPAAAEFQIKRVRRLAIWTSHRAKSWSPLAPKTGNSAFWVSLASTCSD